MNIQGSLLQVAEHLEMNLADSAELQTVTIRHTILTPVPFAGPLRHLRAAHRGQELLKKHLTTMQNVGQDNRGIILSIVTAVEGQNTVERETGDLRCEALITIVGSVSDLITYLQDPRLQQDS